MDFSSPLSLQLFACFIAYVWTRDVIYCPFLPCRSSHCYQLPQATRSTHLIPLSLSPSAPYLATPHLSLHRIGSKHISSYFAFRIVMLDAPKKYMYQLQSTKFNAFNFREKRSNAFEMHDWAQSTYMNKHSDLPVPIYTKSSMISLRNADPSMYFRNSHK